MEKAVITQSTNKLRSEIVFHCNAVLTDVIVPSSIDIDVKWFVDNKNVHSETFNAKDRVAGVLEEKHWSMGQTVRFFFSFPTFILVSTYLPTNFRSLARSKPSTTSWEPGRRRGGARIWWRVLMSTRDQELWVSRKGAGWWASLWGAQCRSSVRLRTGPSESAASIWSWPSGRWRRSSSVPRVTSWTGWVVSVVSLLWVLPGERGWGVAEIKS